MVRVAVGGFQHETNTFSPINAEFGDFERADGWPPLLRGEEILSGAATGMNIPIAGFIDSARSCNFDLVPLIWCAATPSGRVSTDAFERIAGMLVSDLTRASDIDALYLDLHGAMVTMDHDDGEGELLRRVRAALPPQIPIVASLDLHANISSAMVDLATALVVYRTYPHIDMAATGGRAATLLRRIVETGRVPQRAFRRLDFLIPLPSQCTLIEPAKSIYDGINIPGRGSIHSIDLALGFPAADVPDCGPSIVAYGDDINTVEKHASDLLGVVAGAEPRFKLEVFDPDEGVARALALAKTDHARTVIIADTQDNPGGGAEGDGVVILKALVQQGAQRSVFGVLFDPEAAQDAHAAGKGAELNIAIGARSRYKDATPLEDRFKVVELGDGRFTCRGSYYSGCRMDLGPMAHLRLAGIDIVVASRKQQAADIEMFRHVGLDPAAASVLVLKSSVHFRADFGQIASDIIVVCAPGPNVADPAQQPFRRLRTAMRMRPLGPTIKESSATAIGTGHPVAIDSVG
ncbi:MAG: M81 family metallopeptidase [Proteobacteria bacterium]|nr:M81 family metallopeptidase [Pseudomonadota bacterium]